VYGEWVLSVRRERKKRCCAPTVRTKVSMACKPEKSSWPRKL